jgi:hypothetical protein
MAQVAWAFLGASSLTVRCDTIRPRSDLDPTWRPCHREAHASRADLPQPPVVVDCARARARGAQQEWLRGVRHSAAEGLRCIQRSAAPRGARMSRSADPERRASDNTTLPEKLARETCQGNLPTNLPVLCKTGQSCSIVRLHPTPLVAGVSRAARRLGALSAAVVGDAAHKPRSGRQLRHILAVLKLSTTKGMGVPHQRRVKLHRIPALT